MRIPRSPLLPAVLALLAPVARPAEPKPEVVKAVRAMLDTKKEDERDALKAALLKRPDLDWASLKAGLEAGPYYQKPLETAFGERGSKGTFDIVFTGADGKPRGFSLWVPKKYEAKPLPVLVYLHHDPGTEHVAAGSNKASTALGRFREVSEDRGILVLAPYTAKGAEWWTPEGQRLVAWSLKQLRQRYSIDDDRVALCGALDGGDAVWCLGQQMPGTWSALMPMTGDPYEISAIIRPLFLATLDRMDVLMGVPGKSQGGLGEKDIGRFLSDLGPMFGQRMRITTTIWPQAQGDFSYLEEVAAQIGSFTSDRKRKAYADEVDIETEADTELRSLWLENHGYDPNGVTAPRGADFHSTLLKWTPPALEPPAKKIGVGLDNGNGIPGIVIRNTDLLLLFPGDVILEADGVPLSKVEDLKAVVDKHDWNEEVRLLIARDLKESDVAKFERMEQRYKRYRVKLAELTAAQKPIPGTLWDETEEEGSGEEGPKEVEEDDTAGISSSNDAPKEEDDDKDGGGKGKEKRVVRITERWVKVRRLGGLLVRQDFGASWDPNYDRTEGVRVASVVAGSLAARSGFKEGDLIVQVGGRGIKKIHDVEDALRTIDDGDTPFKFEEEPDGQNAIDFTVRRPNTDGTYQPDMTITVRWVKVKSSRVDARWDKKDNSLYVLANNVSSFTLYFTDDLVEAGKEFHLFINGVPFQDLTDPATAPKYPRNHHGDGAEGDRIYRMQRKRAKVPGWTPDLPWALEQFLTTWDRRQVYGAKLTIDLTKMKAAFEQAHQRATKDEDDMPARLKKAYEEFRGRGKG